MIKIYLLKKASINKFISLLLIFNFVFALSGCASSGTAIPQGGSTMVEVYQEAMQESNTDTLDSARAQFTSLNVTQLSDKANSLNFTRNQTNEITNLFPQLPNPQLVMYVYPHLASEDEVPVPGYTTAFSLYEKNHYALPGEN